MTRPLLYICAPFRRRTPESMELVRRAIARGVELGWCPIFAPWLFDFSTDKGKFLDDERPADRAVCFELDDALLERCAALVVVAPDAVSEGMARDLGAWSVYHRPTFWGVEELAEPRVRL